MTMTCQRIDEVFRCSHAHLRVWPRLSEEADQAAIDAAIRVTRV